MPPCLSGDKHFRIFGQLLIRRRVRPESGKARGQKRPSTIKISGPSAAAAPWLSANRRRNPHRRETWGQTLAPTGLEEMAPRQSPQVYERRAEDSNRDAPAPAHFDSYGQTTIASGAAGDGEVLSPSPPSLATPISCRWEIDGGKAKVSPPAGNLARIFLKHHLPMC